MTSKNDEFPKEVLDAIDVIAKHIEEEWIRSKIKWECCTMWECWSFCGSEESCCNSDCDCSCNCDCSTTINIEELHIHL